MRGLRVAMLVSLLLVAAVAYVAWRLATKPYFPGSAPDLADTYSPGTRPAAQEIGSYDLLGRTVSADSAALLLRTAEGRASLSRERGAIAVTDELVRLGRDAFYVETYGNERFFTDVLGVIGGPINVRSLTRAILGLRGEHTTNLQVELAKDIVVSGRVFKEGTLLHTGLDVPRGAAFPLGLITRVSRGRVRLGITCAACHAAVDSTAGIIMEGAPNTDLNAGLLLALATNSAALFRQTGIDPRRLPAGARTYLDGRGRAAPLPDAQALEDSVDADLLAWPPGNFDSTGDLQNNPTQIPSSYTCGAWPYGWSGFASVGWFHGLTTLNNNVHATNSDPTTGADASLPLLGIDKDLYLGTILQRAANLDFRLPGGTRPSDFFAHIDPTPGAPGINRVTRMPGYPRGSSFMLDGLMANTPGLPVAEQLNGMSAFQNRLAPPPRTGGNSAALARGAAIFDSAACAGCHSGYRFTNNDVIPQAVVGTQPSRATALAAFPRIFEPPRTYAPSTPVPVPSKATILTVPTNITPGAVQLLAYGRGESGGGYKVPSLIGLAVSPPYLHDGGVAAARQALHRVEDRYTVGKPELLGMAGTLGRRVMPDPEASLRVLLDRRLRAAAVATNRASAALRRSNVDGSGHAYWVDADAGFGIGDQDDLISFLLSLDDEPEMLPEALAGVTPGTCAE